MLNDRLRVVGRANLCDLSSKRLGGVGDSRVALRIVQVSVAQRHHGCDEVACLLPQPSRCLYYEHDEVVHGFIIYHARVVASLGVFSEGGGDIVGVSAARVDTRLAGRVGDRNVDEKGRGPLDDLQVDFAGTRVMCYQMKFLVDDCVSAATGAAEGSQGIKDLRMATGPERGVGVARERVVRFRRVFSGEF
jgi:hypothetical protein